MIDSDRIAAIEARYTRYDAAIERYNAALAGENGRESVLAVRELQAAEEDCRCYQAQDISCLRAEVKRLTAEAERLREAQRWIPVTERLPEEETLVLISSAEGVVPGQLNYLGINWSAEDVTHWMPLPAAPEGGRDE